MKLEKIQNNMIFNRKLVWRIWSIWLFLNLSLLIIASRQTAEAGSRIACIYPFNYHMANTSLWAYDITEFIGYALVIPSVVAFLFQRFKRSEKNRFCQMMIFAFKTYIIYSFGFVVIAYWDDSAIIEFYLTIAKAMAMMIVTYYMADDVFDAIAKLKN